MATEIVVLRAVRSALLTNAALKSPLPIATMTIPRQDKLPGISLALVPMTLERTLRTIQWKMYRLQVKTITQGIGDDGPDAVAEPIQTGVTAVLGDPETAQGLLNTALAMTGWWSTKVLEVPEAPMYFDYLGGDKDAKVWCFTQQYELRLEPAA